MKSGHLPGSSNDAGNLNAPLPIARAKLTRQKFNEIGRELTLRTLQETHKSLYLQLFLISPLPLFNLGCFAIGDDRRRGMRREDPRRHTLGGDMLLYATNQHQHQQHLHQQHLHQQHPHQQHLHQLGNKSMDLEVN